MGAPGTDLTGWRWVRGRAGRIDYALWMGGLLLVGWRASTVAAPLVGLICTILWIAVLVRRFHDIGATGWWVLGLFVGQLVAFGVAAGFLGEAMGLAVASYAMALAILVLGLLPGQRLDNRFGPPPGRRRAADVSG